jgi:hypothetical protein
LLLDADIGISQRAHVGTARSAASIGSRVSFGSSGVISSNRRHRSR